MNLPNVPFPSLTPRLVDSRWFSADSPCDEETEVGIAEQRYQSWLTSVAQRFADVNPLGKTAPEPMEEEPETDEEEGNDDSDDTEDSHDEDEEEDLGAEYPMLDVAGAGGARGAGTGTPGTLRPSTAPPSNNNDVIMNDSNINGGTPGNT